jgi:hypothetical protein
MILQPEIAKAFDELLARARAATLARFDERGLAWLCLVPDWTEPLASSCRFPSGAVSIGEFVDDTAAVGLTKTWETIGPLGEPVRWFSATDDRRVELVQYLRDTRQQDLIAEARTIADRLRKVAGSSAPALQNWAVLVRAAASRRGALSSAETLWAQVRDFADRDDTGPALDWIYAGEALGPLLGAPMTAAVARCRRYLERRYRRRIDDRYLRRLLPRREQEAEVGRLLDGPDDLWALHIVGMGGVGKTMLIRSLTAGPFAQRYKIPVARIDFDHINPDYPLSRPGQLLVELSVELSALFTDADQEAGYERFLDDAERLHEISGGPGTDPLAMLRTPQARAVLASFAKLLRTLPKPVLLVLDTCEELAKLHPAGSRIPAVDATFEILERLQEEGRLLGEKRLFRVLFAGRRLLAPAGRDWRADDDSRPPYLENLEERPYLRLLEARGFDRDETVTYLRDRRGLRLDDRLLDAALAFSAEAGRVPGVPRSDRAEPPRYNPYDIDLIGDWLEADPDIDPDALTASGLDAYVAARIFGRLDTELKPAAAAAALLGRFDEQLLSLAGVPATDRAGRPTIAKLVEQEWVDLEREDSSGSRFLQVRAALWPRLQRYASSAGFAEHVGPVRPRLLRELRAHLENAPVRALSFEAVEAYLRLAGPADACAAWATIERRVAEAPADTATSAWSWARSVTERLVGEATGLVISPLLAAVSATLAAAVARTDPAADLRPQWMTVLAGAAAHPDPAVGTELERRAHLGLLAADARHGVAEPAEAHLACLHEALRSGSDLVGAVLASVEALIESRVPLDIGPEELARWLDTAAARLGGSPAVAWGRSLHARLIARHGDISPALGMLEAAQAAALSAVSVPDAALLDWSPPASVLHRIRAERLWLEWADGRVVPPDRVEREIADALASPGDDGWCLIALAGVVLLDRGHAAQGARALAGVSPQADWSPRCALHQGVPPIVVVQARLLLATGAAADARVLLRAAITALSTDRASDARVRWLRIAELELIRALRDLSGASVTGQAIYGDDPDLAAAGWLTAALTEPPRSYTGAELRDGLVGSPPYLSDDTLLHARFRSSTPALLGDDPALVAAIRQRDRGAGPSTAANGAPLSTVAIDLWLDALELAASGVAMPPEPKAPPPPLAAGIAAVRPAAQPGTEFEWARLELRLRILSGDTVLGLAGRVPVHRVGRLCLEEGELLALRRPALSESLLDLAYECGRGAGDWGMAVAAAVTGAVAAVHAGDTAALSGQLERARQAWTGLGSVVDGLPAWADLEDAPEPAPPAQTAAAAAWAGWALRLRALLGHGVPPGAVRPTELDLRPWPEGRSPEPPLPETRRRGSWLGTAAAVAAGALGAVAAIVGLSWPVRLVVSSVSPSTRLGFVPSVLIAWVLAGLIVMAGIVGPQAGRWLLQLFMSFFREDVACEPLDQGQARISVTSELQLVRANAGRWRAAALDIARLGVVSVTLLASLALFGFARRALRGGMVVTEIPLAPKPPGAYRIGRLAGDAVQPFRVTAALHARAYVDQPWEFLLAVSQTKAGVLRRCFRPVTVPWTNLPGVWPAADHAEVVSGQWRAFASEVWTRPARLWSSTRTGSPRQAGSDAGVARVVHVIGTPLLTSAGWRLRVAGTRSSQVSESFDSSQYTPSRADESPAPGLLEPDDPSLSDGVITVVQVDPSGSSIASDPDRAAGLRQFGRQVAVATRQPVIVVPALPVDVARTVMRSLARSVRQQRSEPSLDRTLDWVDGLRRAVLRGRVFGTPSWERLAAAYDIALFWPVTDGKETS